MLIARRLRYLYRQFLLYITCICIGYTLVLYVGSLLLLNNYRHHFFIGYPRLEAFWVGKGSFTTVHGTLHRIAWKLNSAFSTCLSIWLFNFQILSCLIYHDWYVFVECALFWHAVILVVLWYIRGIWNLTMVGIANLNVNWQYLVIRAEFSHSLNIFAGTEEFCCLASCMTWKGMSCNVTRVNWAGVFVDIIQSLTLQMQYMSPSHTEGDALVLKKCT